MAGRGLAIIGCALACTTAPAAPAAAAAPGVVVTRLQADAAPLAAATDSRGRIVVVGSGQAGTRWVAARYSADGVLDKGFGDGGSVLLAAGKGDASDFAKATAVAALPDGRILMAGEAVAPGAADGSFALARLKADGSPDPTFGTSGRVLTDLVPGFDDGARGLVVAPDGSFYALGVAQTAEESQAAVAIRYGPDGARDSAFGGHGLVYIPNVSAEGAGGSGEFTSGVATPSGGLIAAGPRSEPVGGRLRLFLLLSAFTASGGAEASFGDAGAVKVDLGEQTDNVDFGFGAALARRADGGLVAGGNGTKGFAVAAFSAAGAPDASFGTGGLVATDVDGTPSQDTLGGIAALPGGGVLAAGRPSPGTLPRPIEVVRYRSGGELDPSFGTAGTATFGHSDLGAGAHGVSGPIVQSTGRAVIPFATRTPDGTRAFGLLRLTSSGRLDAGFGGAGGRSASDARGAAHAAARAMARMRKRGLLRAGSATVNFDAPSAGALVAQASARVGGRSLVVASGAVLVRGPGTVRLRQRLTPAGRRLLRRGGRLRITEFVKFTPRSGPAKTGTVTISLG